MANLTQWQATELLDVDNLHLGRRRLLCCLLAGCLAWALLGPTAAVAQADKPAAVEPAPEYESVFRRESGWSGADGTYSYPQGPSGTILWGFSDTFFGEIVGGGRAEPYQFLHNTMVTQVGKIFTFPGADQAFTVPDSSGGWFWLFDGTNDREILLGQFEDSRDNDFGFRQTGLWVARYALTQEPMQVSVLDLHRLPFFEQRGQQLITFGPAVLDCKDWLYLYGVHDHDGSRDSVLARVPEGHLAEEAAWEFFDGKGWTKDMWSVVTLFSGAAMEASVHQTRSGDFLYVGTDAGGMGSEIIARVAPTAEGPWSQPTAIFRTPEHRGDIFAYNAKAHPELSKNGRILLSYNVNTSNLAKVVSEAEIYRPRFFWWTPPNPDWVPADP